jgi:hypothetical protein
MSNITNGKREQTVFEENEITCNYLKCLAGMGIAGNGVCFLGGNGKNNCDKFEDEQEFLKKEGLF